jgi:hypothetical protein
VTEREVVRPRPWRSWGVWAPIAVGAVSLWRLIGTESVLAVDVGLIAVSAAVLIATLLGGVEVGPEGVRSRRFTRKRRSARWDEIVTFVGHEKEPVSARLTDGTDLRLFDYAGDGERVARLLEEARERYGSEDPA